MERPQSASVQHSENFQHNNPDVRSCKESLYNKTLSWLRNLKPWTKNRLGSTSHLPELKHSIKYSSSSRLFEIGRSSSETRAESRYPNGDARYPIGETRYPKGNLRYPNGETRYNEDTRYHNGEAKYYGESRYAVESRYPVEETQNVSAECRHPVGEMRYSDINSRYPSGEVGYYNSEFKHSNGNLVFHPSEFRYTGDVSDHHKTNSRFSMGELKREYRHSFVELSSADIELRYSKLESKYCSDLRNSAKSSSNVHSAVSKSPNSELRSKESKKHSKKSSSNTSSLPVGNGAFYKDKPLRNSSTLPRDSKLLGENFNLQMYLQYTYMYISSTVFVSIKPI